MKPYTNCMEVQEDFSALLDDELSPDEREQIEGHLSECAECLRELDALKQVDVAYGGLAKVQAPEDFEEGVRNAIRPRTLRFPFLTGPAASRWMRPAAAMAALFLVVLGGMFAYRQSEPERFQTAGLAGDEAFESFAEENAPASAPVPVASSEVRQLKALADVPAAEPPREEGLVDARDALAADSDGAWESLTFRRKDVPELNESDGPEVSSEAKPKLKLAPMKAEAARGRENAPGGLRGDSPQIQRARPPSSSSPEVSFDSAPEKKLDAVRSLGYLDDKSEARALPPPQALSAEEALEERDEVIGVPSDEFSDDAQMRSEPEDPFRRSQVQRQNGRELEESIEQLVNRANEVGKPVETSKPQRGYTFGRDGTWIERGYKGEKPRTLKRDSKEIAGLLVLDPTIDKLVRRSSRVIFRVDGKWYVLEEAAK